MRRLVQLQKGCHISCCGPHFETLGWSNDYNLSHLLEDYCGDNWEETQDHVRVNKLNQ